MKMIMAVIRPERLQPVKDALKEVGINAMTSISGRIDARRAIQGLHLQTRVVGEAITMEMIM